MRALHTDQKVGFGHVENRPVRTLRTLEQSSLRAELPRENREAGVLRDRRNRRTLSAELPAIVPGPLSARAFISGINLWRTRIFGVLWLVLGIVLVGFLSLTNIMNALAAIFMKFAILSGLGTLGLGILLAVVAAVLFFFLRKVFSDS